MQANATNAILKLQFQPSNGT